MRFVIKISYSLKLVYTDYEEFTATLSTLINGGMREFEIIVEEVEA